MIKRQRVISTKENCLCIRAASSEKEDLGENIFEVAKVLRLIDFQSEKFNTISTKV